MAVSQSVASKGGAFGDSLPKYPFESAEEDFEFQEIFWEKVLEKAEITKHPLLIKEIKNQIQKLQETKNILDLRLPVTEELDFPSQIDLSSWQKKFSNLNSDAAGHTGLVSTPKEAYTGQNELKFSTSPPAKSNQAQIS